MPTDAMQHLDDRRPMVKAGELARVLNVSRATIRRLAAAGRLPRPRLIGRQLRWERDEVDAYLAAAPHPTEAK